MSFTEIALALKKHDDYSARVSKILAYGRSNKEIPRELLLDQVELQNLDIFLTAIASSLLNEYEISDDVWIAPSKFAYRTGYCKPGAWTWLEALHRGLRQSRSFFASYQQEKAVSNTYNISHNVGPINIDSQLSHVVQTVNNSTALSSLSKESLSKMFEDLKSSLSSVPPNHKDDAERIADHAQAISKEVSRQKPSKSLLKISGKGLIEAANALKEVAPAAIGIAQQIAAFLSQPIA